MTFVDAYVNHRGTVTVSEFPDLDSDERPTTREMSREAFRAEFPDAPLQEGLFA